ncbi:uroporphyrinogen-III synthase [Campylobacter sp. faydin G-24]|uniref:Uroporphyrinogen-III synthase n=1 Tax=Campylobacter anatolicus TaxID=2829105 RepID=A0ABS5HFP9_9BACT|nr:uroporphyrinogen-III synthase [Campylobacter anatolicus]MBR8463094.1 uroporphyrinogen-III synthase [Campylobacter anatolicus]
MAKIYLISNTQTNDTNVINLNVSAIKFLDFSVSLSDFDVLVLTSKNSLEALRQNQIKLDKNLGVFAIGELCARAAREFGFTQIYTAFNSHGDDFAYEIIPFLSDKKVLFLKAMQTASNVAEILRQNDINLTQIIAYKNSFNELPKALKPPQNSILIFTAPSSVRNFIKNFGWDKSYKVVAIGRTTANELNKLTIPLIAPVQSIDECIKLAKTLF